MSKLRETYGGVDMPREKWCPDNSYGPLHPSRREMEAEMEGARGMTPERLREACEVAGGECFTASEDTSDWAVGFRPHVYHFEDPALPAYVASVLVEKVRNVDAEVLLLKVACAMYWERELGVGSLEDGAYAWFKFNVSERIAAALVALGYCSLEEAKVALGHWTLEEEVE